MKYLLKTLWLISLFVSFGCLEKKPEKPAPKSKSKLTPSEQVSETPTEVDEPAPSPEPTLEPVVTESPLPEPAPSTPPVEEPKEPTPPVETPEEDDPWTPIESPTPTPEEPEAPTPLPADSLILGSFERICFKKEKSRVYQSQTITVRNDFSYEKKSLIYPEKDCQTLHATVREEGTFTLTKEGEVVQDIDFLMMREMVTVTEQGLENDYYKQLKDECKQEVDVEFNAFECLGWDPIKTYTIIEAQTEGIKLGIYGDGNNGSFPEDRHTQLSEIFKRL